MLKYQRVAVALVASLPLVLSAALAASPATAANILASGTILDQSGAPLAAAAVTVVGIPTPDANGVVTPRLLGISTTAGDGSYSVAGQLPAGTKFLDPATGNVKLEVRAVDTNGTAVVTNLEVPPNNTTPAAVGLRMGHGPTAGMDAAAPMLVSAETTDLGDGAAVDGSVDDPDGVDTAPMPLSSELASDLSASSCKSGYLWAWKTQAIYKRALVPVVRVTTRDWTKQNYTYVKTNQTRLSVAFTGSGGYYAGGLEGSIQNSTENGKILRVDPNDSRLWKLEWRFQRSQMFCYNDYTGNWYYLGVYKWEPDEFTEGDAIPVNWPQWDCGNGDTITMHTDTWNAKTSSVRWNAWYSLTGSKPDGSSWTIKMDTKTTNATKQELWVNVLNQDHGAKLCGDNALPPDADRVKERIW